MTSENLHKAIGQVDAIRAVIDLVHDMREPVSNIDGRIRYVVDVNAISLALVELAKQFEEAA